MLNLNQLRTFYQVAKSLNFSVAAENLFVSQPAVTKQIKNFEEFCNLKLFRKKRAKIQLYIIRFSGTKQFKSCIIPYERVGRIARQT